MTTEWSANCWWLVSQLDEIQSKWGRTESKVVSSLVFSIFNFSDGVMATWQRDSDREETNGWRLSLLLCLKGMCTYLRSTQQNIVKDAVVWNESKRTVRLCYQSYWHWNWSSIMSDNFESVDILGLTADITWNGESRKANCHRVSTLGKVMPKNKIVLPIPYPALIITTTQNGAMQCVQMCMCVCLLRPVVQHLLYRW